MRSGSASPKSPLDLVPGELHDRAAPVHIVRRQRRGGERDEECAHLAGRKNLTRLDRSLAGERGRESLVPRRHASIAIAAQRVERLAQAAWRVEARMRHRHATHDQRMPSESLDLEAELLEQLLMRLERFPLCGPQDAA